MMADAPSDSVIMRNRESDDAYMKEIVTQNESLSIEVEQLRLQLCEKGLDQLKRLRAENAELQLKLKTAESQLSEKKAQLDMLAPTVQRFDGVHSALREMSEHMKKLSEARAHSAEPPQQSASATAEIARLRAALDHAVASQRTSEERVRLLEEEKAAMVRRYAIGGDAVAQLQRQVENFRQEKSKMNAMQQRAQSMFQNRNVDIKDIKVLFSEMLDYQQQSDEEKNTNSLIYELKVEDMEKAYERKIEDLKSEIKTLRSALNIYKRQQQQQQQQTEAAAISTAHDASGAFTTQTPTQTPRYAPASAAAGLAAPIQSHATARPTRYDTSDGNSLIRNSLAPPPGESRPKEQYHNLHTATPSGRGGDTTRCSTCTFINPADATVCQMCNRRI